MYEITIRNLETNEVVDTAQNEMVLAIVYSDSDANVAMLGNVKNLANALKMNGNVRAACRLAIADFDARKDVEQEEIRKMKEEIKERLGALGEKMGADVMAVDVADLVGEE